MNSKDLETKLFYDKYPFKSKNSGFKRRFIIESTLPKRGKVLVAGCGTGRECYIINGINPELEITAVDISSKSLEMLPDFVKAKHASVLDLPFKDNTFDAVISIGVLHHTSNPEKGFSELARVLKPGKAIVIMVYSKNSWLEIIYKISKHTPNFIKNRIKNNLIQDALFTPQASFHTFDEVIQWFSLYGIMLFHDFKILKGSRYYMGFKQY